MIQHVALSIAAACFGVASIINAFSSGLSLAAHRKRKAAALFLSAILFGICAAAYLILLTGVTA